MRLEAGVTQRRSARPYSRLIDCRAAITSVRRIHRSRADEGSDLHPCAPTLCRGSRRFRAASSTSRAPPACEALIYRSSPGSNLKTRVSRRVPLNGIHRRGCVRVHRSRRHGRAVRARRRRVAHREARHQDLRRRVLAECSAFEGHGTTEAQLRDCAGEGDQVEPTVTGSMASPCQ
jgi:hypothetical protein